MTPIETEYCLEEQNQEVRMGIGNHHNSVSVSNDESSRHFNSVFEHQNNENLSSDEIGKSPSTPSMVTSCGNGMVGLNSDEWGKFR